MKPGLRWYDCRSNALVAAAPAKRQEWVWLSPEAANSYVNIGSPNFARSVGDVISSCRRPKTLSWYQQLQQCGPLQLLGNVPKTKLLSTHWTHTHTQIHKQAVQDSECVSQRMKWRWTEQIKPFFPQFWQLVTLRLHLFVMNTLYWCLQVTAGQSFSSSYGTSDVLIAATMQSISSLCPELQHKCGWLEHLVYLY